MHGLIAATLALALVWPAFADEPPDGLVLSPTALPLAPPHPTAAVGVVSVKKRGTCTGTLIAPDLVLTAAHCVTSKVIRKQPHVVGFRTGAYPGAPSVDRIAAEIVYHPLYASEDDAMRRKTGFDIALIRLSEPIPDSVAEPFPISKAPIESDRLILASLRGARGDRARERSCPRLSSSEWVVIIGCDVEKGESGSPVLERRDGGLAIVGVMSAKAETGPQKLGFAAGTARIGQIVALMGTELPDP